MYMLPLDMQMSNERKFSRKHVDKYIRTELSQDKEIRASIERGIALYLAWVNTTYSYSSKNERLAQLRPLDEKELVTEIVVATCYCQRKEPITSVAVQLANRLGFDDKREGILTSAELLAVLCETDLFDLIKPELSDTIMVKSNIGFSDELNGYIAMSMYLPPLVCQPREITHNYQSGYYTHNDSVILKSYNHHNGDVCLDVINIQNSIKFSLDVDFLRSMNEDPTSDLDEIEVKPWMNAKQIADAIRQKRENWEMYYSQSQQVYMLMVSQGNKFYLTNKVDKRGRLYSQGYHITPQGYKYKKAMLDFADKEFITGVP